MSRFTVAPLPVALAETQEAGAQACAPASYDGDWFLSWRQQYRVNHVDHSVGNLNVSDDDQRIVDPYVVASDGDADRLALHGNRRFERDHTVRSHVAGVTDRRPALIRLRLLA